MIKLGLGKKHTEQDTGPDLSRALARALDNPLKSGASHPKPDASQLDVLGAIESAFYVIDAAREKLVETSMIVLKAVEVEDAANRALLAEQYDDHRTAVERIILEKDERALQLIGPDARPVTVELNTHGSYTIGATPLTLLEGSLDLPPPVDGFDGNAEIASILGKLEAAIALLDRTAKFYMKDARFIMSRIEKTDPPV